jgi:hypothetical protein
MSEDVNIGFPPRDELPVVPDPTIAIVVTVKRSHRLSQLVIAAA